MTEHLVIGLGAIILAGTLAQWLAWRLHIPSILLLLLFGFLVGPVTGIVETDRLFGDLLFPFVSISVAIILFEGGLSLTKSEFQEIGRITRNLITIGALITWILTTASAYYIMKLEFDIALLLGAILVVTGPTVILPLLRHVRPTGKVGAIAKWEGIMIDPVGAVLAVLVFEEIISGGLDQFSVQSLFGLLKTLLIGIVIGWVAAKIIIFFLKRYWIPDYLHNSAAIMMVVGAYILSNFFQGESGLLSVTIMGIVLANQKEVSIKHIIEFKENLRVLLISSLFIILAARVKLTDLTNISLELILFLGVLIFITRPLGVFASTIGKDLNWREKVFLSWMAPRGIVAAAVSSLFALLLTDAGIESAARLVPITFIVIITTVTLYGLTASPVARLLKLAMPNPQGVLFIGAHSWARRLGNIIKEHGIKVIFIDTNVSNCRAANKMGLKTVSDNVLSENIKDKINLDGIGKLFAMTPNNEVNGLAALHFSEVFGSAELYQLPYDNLSNGKSASVSRHLRGRFLFGQDMTYSVLTKLLNTPDSLKKMTITAEFTGWDSLQTHQIPLFLLTESGNLIPFTDEPPSAPIVGQTLIYIEDKNNERVNTEG